MVHNIDNAARLMLDPFNQAYEKKQVLVLTALFLTCITAGLLLIASALWRHLRKAETAALGPNQTHEKIGQLFSRMMGYLHRDAAPVIPEPLYLVPARPQLLQAAAISIAHASPVELQQQSAQELDKKMGAEMQLLQRLDTDFEDLRLIASLINKGTITPSFSLTPEEEKALPEAYRKATQLGDYLYNKYKEEFAHSGWHGFTSFQRILWQDNLFIQTITDPLIIKAILIRAQKEGDKKMGGCYLSQLVLQGLASNRLSYLASVSPNWHNQPTVKGVTWESLKVMKCGGEPKLEKPRQISLEYLIGLENRLNTMRIVFRSIPNISKNISREIGERYSIQLEITKASTEDLIRVFKNLVNSDEQISKLTAGVAGKTTAPVAMAGQCLEVMMNYPELLKAHKGNHVEVLGYGLNSHALDAKHLAATLYFLLNPHSKMNPTLQKAYNKVIPAMDYFADLVNKARDGSLDPLADRLFKIRLQQTIALTINGLGLNADAVAKIFSAVKQG